MLEYFITSIVETRTSSTIMKGLAILVCCAAVALAAQPRSISLDAASACAQEDTDDLVVAHENCNRFNKCSGGVLTTLECPAGLFFNINDQICDWPTNVDCGERTVIESNGSGSNESNDSGSADNGAWQPVHGYDDPSQALAICAADESDGVLVAHENCNQFYKCLEGKPFALSCPLSLKYQPKLEACDWPQNVDCAGRI